MFQKNAAASSGTTAKVFRTSANVLLSGRGCAPTLRQWNTPLRIGMVMVAIVRVALHTVTANHDESKAQGFYSSSSLLDSLCIL